MRRSPPRRRGLQGQAAGRSARRSRRRPRGRRRSPSRPTRIASASGSASSTGCRAAATLDSALDRERPRRADRPHHRAHKGHSGAARREVLRASAGQNRPGYAGLSCRGAGVVRASSRRGGGGRRGRPRPGGPRARAVADRRARAAHEAGGRDRSHPAADDRHGRLRRAAAHLAHGRRVAGSTPRATRRSPGSPATPPGTGGATAVHDSTALAVPAILDGHYPRAGLRSDVLLASGEPVHAARASLRGARVRGGDRAAARRACASRRRARPRATSRAGSPSASAPSCARWSGGLGRRSGSSTCCCRTCRGSSIPRARRYRPHAPEPIPGLNGPLGFGVPWLVKVSYQRHLLQLGLADRLLGELLARLRRLELYRDALVVVVADHGIGFHLGVERRDGHAAQRGGPRACPAAGEAAAPAPRPRRGPPRRDDRHAPDDPRAAGPTGAAARRRPLAAPPRSPRRRAA